MKIAKRWRKGTKFSNYLLFFLLAGLAFIFTLILFVWAKQKSEQKEDALNLDKDEPTEQKERRLFLRFSNSFGTWKIMSFVQSSADCVCLNGLSFGCEKGEQQQTWKEMKTKMKKKNKIERQSCKAWLPVSNSGFGRKLDDNERKAIAHQTNGRWAPSLKSAVKVMRNRLTTSLSNF